MSHFESPEHCYDFHSVVKCFSPLNWLVLESDIKVLTLETVRMNSGQQKRSPQQHRSSLGFTPVGGWRAPEQHNLQLPIPKSWGLQWRIAHHACLKSQGWDVAPLTISCPPSFGVGGWDFWMLPSPEPSTHFHSRCPFQVHPCSSEMPSNYMQTLNKRAV